MLSATSGKSLEYQTLFCYNYIEQMFCLTIRRKNILAFYRRKTGLWDTWLDKI